MNLLPLLAMSLGGGLGAILRWYCCYYAANLHPKYAYYAMFIINITGSFVIGYTSGLVSYHHTWLSPTLSTAITSGYCGGFTSFSTVQLDAVKLWKTHRQPLAIFNITINICGSWVLCTCGFMISAL